MIHTTTNETTYLITPIKKTNIAAELEFSRYKIRMSSIVISCISSLPGVGLTYFGHISSSPVITGTGASLVALSACCCFCWAKYKFCPEQTDCFDKCLDLA